MCDELHTLGTCCEGWYRGHRGSGIEISGLGLDDEETAAAAGFSNLFALHEPTSSTSRTGSVAFEMI